MIVWIRYTNVLGKRNILSYRLFSLPIVSFSKLDSDFFTLKVYFKIRKNFNDFFFFRIYTIPRKIYSKSVSYRFIHINIILS